MTRILSLGMALVLLMLQSCISDDVPENVGVEAGSPLPDFSVALSDGRIVSRSSLRGKVAVVELFNTECPDCRRSLPEVDEAFRMWEDNPDVEFVAIAREEDAQSVAAFWSAHNLALPWSAQPDRSVYNLFASVGIPRLYIADLEGTITAAFSPEAAPDAERISLEISKALAGKVRQM